MLKFFAVNLKWISFNMQKLLVICLLLSIIFCANAFTERSFTRSPIATPSLSTKNRIKYQVRPATMQSILTIRGGSTNVVLRDVAFSLFIISETVVWLKLWSYLAAKGILSPNITRKIIHTFSAPIFLFHWPFYRSENKVGRWIAAMIPIVQVSR